MNDWIRRGECNMCGDCCRHATNLGTRLAAMVSSIQIMGERLFSLKAFSKSAWEETMNHVKAIDAWAASEIKGVAVAQRDQAKSTAEQAYIAALTAADTAYVIATQAAESRLIDLRASLRQDGKWTTKP